MAASGGPADAPAAGGPAPRGLVAAASWLTGAHLVAQLAAYASLIVLARLIPPASFGLVAGATAVVWIAAVLLEAGAHGSIVVARGLTGAFLRGAFLRSLALALALGLAFLAGAQLLVGSVLEDESAAAVAALALCLPLYALGVVPTALLQRGLAFRSLAAATAGSNVGAAVVAVALGLAGAGIWALVTRQLLWFGLLALLAAVLARRALPGRLRADAGGAAPASADRWFFLFQLTLLVTLNVDYLVLGGFEGAEAVGLYAIAFVIAFAPVDHFSAEVGKVLFAAAAASGRAATAERTEQAVRALAWLLLPLLPPALVLAPVLVPPVLGDEWEPMVAALQLLLVVGVGHAILNCVGEALSGGGEIAFRARVNGGWALSTLAALLVLVPLDGVRGAALAHLAVLVPYAAVYLTAGARRVGTSAAGLWGALRPAFALVAVQGAVTVAGLAALRSAGVGDGAAAAVGAAAGLAALAGLVARDRGGAARDGAALLRAALRGDA